MGAWVVAVYCCTGVFADPVVLTVVKAAGKLLKKLVPNCVVMYELREADVENVLTGNEAV